MVELLLLTFLGHALLRLLDGGQKVAEVSGSIRLARALEPAVEGGAADANTAGGGGVA